MAKGYDDKQSMLRYSMTEQLEHGMAVSNLTYHIASRMDMDEEVRKELTVAGFLHDIGKSTLAEEAEAVIEGQPLYVEEMKYIRLHSVRGYEILKRHGYSDIICESVLYHHENYDGSGYPHHLSGEEIPFGARILRIAEEFNGLIEPRAYGGGSRTPEWAFYLMTTEIKNFDLKIFLVFQDLLHDNPSGEIRVPESTIDMRGELYKIWH